MTKRGLLAGGVVVLWLGGLGVLARRQLSSAQGDRLSRAALFLAPGAEFYEVSDGSRQIGFASSTIDTAARSVTISDRVIGVLGRGSAQRRVAALATVQLTRTLKVRQFRYQTGQDLGAYVVSGSVDGDSLLTLVVRSGDVPPDSQRLRLRGPLLLPTMVPMAIALGDRPRVGNTYTYQVFDPLRVALARMTVRVRAESLFVLPDSARLDSASRTWVPAHRDSVRAWRIEQEGGRLLTGWIDASGRMVEAAPLADFRLRRSAYELAVQNWNLRQAAAAGAPPDTVHLP